MLILQFLWKYKIGIIGGALFATVNWFLFPYISCYFYSSHQGLPECESQIYEFISSSTPLIWVIVALNSLFFTFPIGFVIGISLTGSLYLLLSVIYLSCLGGFLEFGIRKLLGKLRKD